MIIDLILDRKDGTAYSARTFYNDVMQYGDISHGIASAMDGGNDDDVKGELCKYIADHDYNHDICDFINSVSWL